MSNWLLLAFGYPQIAESAIPHCRAAPQNVVVVAGFKQSVSSAPVLKLINAISHKSNCCLHQNYFHPSLDGH
jgi:hypothetical protein